MLGGGVRRREGEGGRNGGRCCSSSSYTVIGLFFLSFFFLPCRKFWHINNSPNISFPFSSSFLFFPSSSESNPSLAFIPLAACRRIWKRAR